LAPCFLRCHAELSERLVFCLWIPI
jgi:hypothetical protein